MGIDHEAWVQLWSGAGGAVFSAVLAAMVAFIVAWRTNSHQTKLSGLERSESYKQFQRGMKEQRKLAQEQLQSGILESRRASTVRAIAEIATAVEAMGEYPIRDLSPEESVVRLQGLNLQVKRSLHELAMLGPEAGEVHALVRRWPHVLVSLAAAYEIDMGNRDSLTELSESIRKIFANIFTLLPGWVDGNVSQRNHISSMLEQNFLLAEEILD